jgi:hypothetical protein
VRNEGGRVSMRRLNWLSLVGLVMCTLATSAAAASTMSTAARVADQSTAGGAIPASYRGRWAPSLHACRVDGPRTQAVEITAKGWTSFEDGSRILAPGKVLRGTLYHEVASFGSGGESKRGTLALRLAGNRLAMSETVSGRTIHRHLMRCR